MRQGSRPRTVALVSGRKRGASVGRYGTFHLILYFGNETRNECEALQPYTI
jgi:hypothetical protein